MRPSISGNIPKRSESVFPNKLEHRRYGHVDVFIFKQTLAHCGQGGTGRQRV